MFAIFARPPLACRCGGPLCEVGDEQVHGFPAVFAVEYCCRACSMVTRRIDVGGSWHW